MTSLTKPVRLGASIAATALETTASQLRKISGDGQEEEPQAAAPAEHETQASEPTPAAPEPGPAPAERGNKPASGTRSRIANPKAARKVRSRAQ